MTLSVDGVGGAAAGRAGWVGGAAAGRAGWVGFFAGGDAAAYAPEAGVARSFAARAGRVSGLSGGALGFRGVNAGASSGPAMLAGGLRCGAGLGGIVGGTFSAWWRPVRSNGRSCAAGFCSQRTPPGPSGVDPATGALAGGDAMALKAADTSTSAGKDSVLATGPVSS
jgi:hypothetical protein